MIIGEVPIDDMFLNIRSSGWKTALETIAANTKPTIIEHRGEGNNGVDPQLLASMQDHWHRAELQLAEKLQEMQQKVCFIGLWAVL